MKKLVKNWENSEELNWSVGEIAYTNGEEVTSLEKEGYVKIEIFEEDSEAIYYEEI